MDLLRGDRLLVEGLDRLRGTVFVGSDLVYLHNFALSISQWCLRRMIIKIDIGIALISGWVG